MYIGENIYKIKGSNPSEWHIFYVFRCVLSFSAVWRSVGMSNFDWGLQKLNNVDSNIKNYYVKNRIN